MRSNIIPLAKTGINACGVSYQTGVASAKPDTMKQENSRLVDLYRFLLAEIMILKLAGRYSTYTTSYNKCRMYIVLTENAYEVIKELYALTTMTSKMMINGGEQITAEIVEINVKSGKTSIVVEAEINESVIHKIASHAFDRSITLEFVYDGEKSRPRVSNAFYSKLTKTMDRMATALGMATVIELKSAVDMAYSYNVPLNANMYKDDAEQLYDILVKYAEEVLPDFEIEIGINNDAFLLKRANAKKCALCDGTQVALTHGIPLCVNHSREINSLGRDKFFAKHHL
ncbi:MAG: hypothetical protein Q8M92_02645 [Candidatus Subteraquimicrobiales bacterium]|nr:hypothetical protein [Candidatus Subteraquimicrobiales bacterium]